MTDEAELPETDPILLSTVLMTKPWPSGPAAEGAIADPLFVTAASARAAGGRHRGVLGGVAPVVTIAVHTVLTVMCVIAGRLLTAFALPALGAAADLVLTLMGLG